MPNAQALLEKIQALPPERLSEVEDFVDFIAAREQERALTRAEAARRGMRNLLAEPEILEEAARIGLGCRHAAP